MKLIKGFHATIVLPLIFSIFLATGGVALRLGGAVGLGAVVVTQTACPKEDKDRNVAFAKDLSGALKLAAPIIAQKKPQLAAKMTQAINAADRLIDAIDRSDKTTAASLINEILPIFTEVAREFTNDTNILLALALGQIALNFFVNHYLKTVAGGALKFDRTVEEFKALPQFGCQLRPEYCR